MQKSSLYKLVGAILIIGLIFVFPVEIAELLAWMAEQLFDMLEYTLDEIIGELFHTNLHITQVIVFYILLGLFLYLMYKLWQKLKAAYFKLKFKLSNFRSTR